MSAVCSKHTQTVQKQKKLVLKIIIFHAIRHVKAATPQIPKVYFFFSNRCKQLNLSTCTCTCTRPAKKSVIGASLVNFFHYSGNVISPLATRDTMFI